MISKEQSIGQECLDRLNISMKIRFKLDHDATNTYPNTYTLEMIQHFSVDRLLKYTDAVCNETELLILGLG